MLGFLLGKPPRKRMNADGQWTLIGGYPSTRAKTRGGVQVDEQIALTYSACWAATARTTGRATASRSPN